jgi:hypothetical protein
MMVVPLKFGKIWTLLIDSHACVVRTHLSFKKFARNQAVASNWCIQTHPIDKTKKCVSKNQVRPQDFWKIIQA